MCIKVVQHAQPPKIVLLRVNNFFKSHVTLPIDSNSMPLYNHYQ